MAERTARTSGRTRPTSADTTGTSGERRRSARTTKRRAGESAATPRKSSGAGTTTDSRSRSSRDRAGAKRQVPTSTSSSNGRRSSSGAELARRIRDDLGDLLGVPTERVIGMRRDGDTWQATVEVLELRRIPETMDLLAVYQVSVDRRGEIESWERLGRYARSESQGE